MDSNISSTFRILDTSRIHQGDMLKDFELSKRITNQNNPNFELNDLPFCFIISQDCDLEGMTNLNSIIKNRYFDKNNAINGNKFLPSIIYAPAFVANDVNNGSYLIDLGYRMDNKGGKNKSKWKSIVNNNDPRYHYIDSNELGIEDLVIDFKIFFTAPYDDIFSRYPNSYKCSLNELFRERLSQRFFEYHARIGLPPV